MDEIRENHCAFTCPFCHHWAKHWHSVFQIADIANLPRLIMCAQCDSNVALIPGLPIFLFFSVINSWKW